MFLRAFAKTKQIKTTRIQRQLMTFGEAHDKKLLNAVATNYMDKKGNTPLHYTILNCKSARDIRDFINGNDPDAVSIMSKTNNNEGVIPYDMLSYNRDVPKEDRDTILLLLKEFMMKNDLKPLTEPINTEAIMQQYAQEDQHLQYNLKSGCELANQTRSIIKESSTHPEVNHYSEEQQLRIKNNIAIMRSCYPNPYPYESYIKYVAEMVDEEKIGNCFEGSAKTMTLNKDPLTYGSIDHVTDHDVYKLNSYQPITHKENTENAVIVDSWGGDVYSRKEIPYRMNGYIKYPLGYHSSVRVITSFNTACHKVESGFAVYNNPPRKFF